MLTTLEAYLATNGNLLILGEPGSGKSTTLEGIAVSLAEVASGDDDEPIPLLLRVAANRGIRRRFHDWVIDSALEQLGVPENVCRAWLQRGEIALLIDGLDELTARELRAFVGEISKFRLGSPDIAVTAACRLGDFQQKAFSLDVGSVCEIRPLSRQAVESALVSAHGEDSEVLQLCRSDAELCDLLRTPLFLRFAVDMPEPRMPMRTQAGAEWKRWLVSAYVEYCAENQNRDFAPKAVPPLEWLPLLASNIKKSGASRVYPDRYALEYLPERLRGSVLSRASLWTRILLVGLVVPRVIPLVIAHGMTGDVLVLAIGAASSAFLLNVQVSFRMRKAMGRTPGGRRLLVRSELIRLVRFWAIPYLVVLIYYSWGPSLPLWHYADDILGLIPIFLFYPIIQIVRGSIVPDHRDAPERPRRELQDQLASAVICFIVSYLIGYLTLTLDGASLIAFLSGMIKASPYELAAFYSASFAAVGALLNGGSDFILRMVAIRRSVREGLVPRSYFRSFERAQLAALLVPRGGGYEFIHSIVRDYLANSSLPNESALVDHGRRLRP